MEPTRRSLIKRGLAGLVLPQLWVYPAKATTGQSFDTWRLAFEAGIPARMKAANVVGVSVAICSKEKAVFYAESFGFANIKEQRKLTPSTPMHTASISKLFTATALVQLFERRRLDLHANVNNFINFAVINPHSPDNPITPHHLLSHTSSIFDEGYGDVSHAGDPNQGLRDFLCSYLVEGGSKYSRETSYLKKRPGERWEYSNVGMALAGYVVESVAQQKFSSYIEENVLAPIGITNAHWYLSEFPSRVLAAPYKYVNGRFKELPQQGYPDVPSGMLRISVEDLARTLHAMLGQNKNKAILSPASVKKMLRRQIDQKIYPYQGLGWTEEETLTRKVIGHTGSDNGTLNIVALNEDETCAIVVLTNTDATPELSNFRASVADDLLKGATFTT